MYFNLIKFSANVNFEENGKTAHMFMIPCKVTKDNVVYDSKNIFFDSIAYENYSLCIIAPIKDRNICTVEITNKQGEIYQGITLKGIIINGVYEMELVIPIYNNYIDSKYIVEFSSYSIIQNQAFSSVTYSEDGRRTLIEELANSEIELSKKEREPIIYKYSMTNLGDVESSPLFLILTIIVIPSLMTLFSMIFAEDNKEEKLKLRYKIMYGYIILSIIPLVIIIIKGQLPIWGIVATAVLYILCIVLIIANNFTRLKKWCESFLSKHHKKED